ncbi:MAG: hypothetical protein V1897_00325 [Pseudomonadota bacterium]
MKIPPIHLNLKLFACLLVTLLLAVLFCESGAAPAAATKSKSGDVECPYYRLPESLIDIGFELGGEKVPISIPDVKERIEFQINFLLLDARSVLAEWMNEKRKYSWILEEILTKEGVPKDFAWLSPVMTGVNRTSNSRTPPVGIWSLNKPCDLSEGLEMHDDAWRDDRLDIFLATKCFASRIKALKGELGNSWLAASVANVLSVQDVKDLTQRWESASVWDIPLPDQLEDMISRWAAFKIIGTHRSVFGLRFPDPPPLTYDNLTAIELTKDLAVKDIGKFLNVPAKLILELNPKIKISSGVFPAKMNGKTLTHSIAVPSGVGKVFLRKLQEAGYVAGYRQ